MKQNNEKLQLRVALMVFVLFLFLTNGGCTLPSTNKTPIVTQTATQETPQAVYSTNNSSEAPTLTPTYEPIKNIGGQEKRLTGYSFITIVDYIKHQVKVDQTVRYWNNSSMNLPELKMVVPPNQNTGVFQLESIKLTGKSTLKEILLDGIVLTIELEDPLPTGDFIDLNIHYRLNLPPTQGVLGYTAKQTNLSDWYPFFPPYTEEEGWMIHQPAKIGEYLVYNRANFDLVLTVQGPEDLIIAANATVVPNLNNYQVSVYDARNISLSISDEYKILSKQFGDTVIQGYIFKEDEDSGWAAIEITGNAILLFSDLFGVSYPHGTMTIVESDFPDGMEYDGLYFLSQDYFKTFSKSLKNYLTLLSVHETAHQWWYGITGNDQALESWLDESLATYSEYLYLEAFHPELTDWWWEYRVATYKPEGNLGMTIYDQSNLRTYINAVYLRGAMFLHEVRQLLGDEAFFTNLKLYQNAYRHQIANRDDFLSIFMPVPSEPFITLVQKYFTN
ncbi:MAG: hypothetical protein C0401_07580 [Anaerolinea sp.]|nr:hypothetical protein [Anaerolinea sp.]